jgi:hypothetical protein
MDVGFVGGFVVALFSRALVVLSSFTALCLYVSLHPLHFDLCNG